MCRELGGRSYSGTSEEMTEPSAAMGQLSLVINTHTYLSPPPQHMQTSPISLQCISVNDPVLFIVPEHSCIR